MSAARPRGRAGVFWLGARPRTLVAAIVPVLVGAASVGRTAISLPRSLLALVVALGLQVGVNYANDYFDGVRGVDSPARMGPTRLVASGLARASQVAFASFLAIVVAAIAGVALSLLTAPWLIAVGALAIAALLLYSGGSNPYGARGLGELSVFVFFGLVATAGTAYVQQQRLSIAVLWVAIPVGLLASALLIINNIRDIPTDRDAGKRTLAVRLGVSRARAVLVATVVIALLLPPLGAALGALPRLAALSAIVAPLAWPPLRTALAADGRALIPALIGITRLELAFGVVLAAALLAS